MVDFLSYSQSNVILEGRLLFAILDGISRFSVLDVLSLGVLDGGAGELTCRKCERCCLAKTVKWLGIS